MIHAATPSTQFVCSKPVVISGDTLRCDGNGLVHLAGIMAPPCAPGGHCVTKRAEDARLGLEWTLGYGPITLSAAGRDRDGSVIAVATIGSRNLSCWQLGWKVAAYSHTRDSDGRIAQICASNIRGKKGAGL